MKTYRKSTQKLSSDNNKVESTNIQTNEQHTKLEQKQQHMEVPKMKSLTMTNCEITKLIPPMFTIRNILGML
jgi:hypothetical protein